MKPKQRIKMAIDLLMTLSLLLLMSYELIGQATHEVTGTVMFLLFLLHHALNLGWSRNILRRRYTPFRAVQTLLVGLILVLMLTQAVSGVMLSRHLYTFLPLSGGAYWARTVHMQGAYWNFVLISLHLGFHWSMMLAALKRAGVTPGRTIALRVLGAGIAVFGVTAFLRREIGAYLLGQIQFAFFDFEEPLALFLLDYLAIMGLFVWAGHYLGTILRKFVNFYKSP